MSAETNAALGPKPWAFLADGPCDAAYGPSLIGINAGLATTVDEYVKANGVTDDLLELFAPAARGEMIVFVAMAGHVIAADGDAGTQAPPATPPPTPRGGGGGRGRHGGGSMPAHAGHRAVDRGAVEWSASFYSVPLRRAVAIAETRYTGTNADSAWKAFSTKLAASLPGATCSGWNWDVAIDANRLRHMTEENASSSSRE
jgi:hypothetical protein